MKYFTEFLQCMQHFFNFSNVTVILLTSYWQFGLVHISTGDLLRDEVSSGTEIGNKVKEFMNAGKLVPDEIVTAVLHK